MFAALKRLRAERFVDSLEQVEVSEDKLCGGEMGQQNFGGGLPTEER